MKFHQIIIAIFLISLLCADNQTAEDILLKSLHRMDGIDHCFKVDSQESRKKKEKHFQVSIHWPSEGKLLRQIRIISINSKRKKPSSFWDHRYKDGTKAKTWMSLPVTGNLKDVSDKKSGNKYFSFSELSVQDEDIKSHTHKLLPSEKIDTLFAYVVESIKKNKNGKVKESKKLWIDVKSYMILKAEFYTGSGRLYRNIECSNIDHIQNILFPLSIYIQDLKSKTDIQILIKDIELNPIFDMDIFSPKDQ